jgi:phenylacetate-coenzyme A ligase PaaK-like adenylate-forming protein
MWGVDLFVRRAMLWGHAASFAPGWAGKLARIRQPWEDRLRSRLRLSAYRLGPEDLNAYLGQIERFQPALLYGYSSAVALLAREARLQSRNCPSLRLCMLSGEPAFPEMIQDIELAFRAPAVIEYGSMETGIMANEWPDRTLRVRDDIVLVETVSRDDGHYDIIASVLVNFAFPLLRYAIGDVTNAPLRVPERGFAILDQVMGRKNDMLRSSQGRLVHSLGVKHVFEHYRGVRRFSAHQDSTGRLTVLLEADAGGHNVDLADAAGKLERLLGGFPVTIQEVESIPNTRAGKHRWVASDLVAP